MTASSLADPQIPSVPIEQYCNTSEQRDFFAGFDFGQDAFLQPGADDDCGISFDAFANEMSQPMDLYEIPGQG